MRDFMIDTDVTAKKGSIGREYLDNMINHLKDFDSERSSAFFEINSHGGLGSVCNVSIMPQLNELNTYVDRYEKFGNTYGQEYSEEVDNVFFREQEDVLNELINIKFEDIEVVCNIGNKCNANMNFDSMVKYINENYIHENIKTLTAKAQEVLDTSNEEINEGVSKAYKAVKASAFDIGCGAILAKGAIFSLLSKYKDPTGITFNAAFLGTCMIASGLNAVKNGLDDILRMIGNKWNEVGSTNYLKDTLELKGGDVAELVNADRGIGKSAGDILNAVIDTGAMIGGVVSAVKGLPSIMSNFNKCEVYSIKNVLLPPEYLTTVRQVPISVAAYNVYDTIGNKFSADSIYQDIKTVCGFDSSTTIFDDVLNGADYLYKYLTQEKVSTVTN